MPDATRSREQELASDQRAGVWARTSARNRQRSFARLTWRLLAALAVLMLSLFGALAFLTPSGFQRGFMVGAGVAITAAALHAFVLLFSGTASTIVGDLAEQWTAQELRPLTEHGWKLVNHFGLGYGDNDHVLIGPGGVVLVETKWNGHEWKGVEQDPRVRDAARQVREGARRLLLWSGLRKHGIAEVRTVVVLWGRHKDATALPTGGRRDPDGTVIIRGKDVRDWALRLGRDKITHAQISGVWNEMDLQLRGRDALEQARNPLPRSMGELATTAMSCLGLACAGVVASSEVLKFTSVPLWTGVVVLSLVIGAAARRSSRLRVLANAWLIGSAVIPVVWTLDFAWASVR